MSAPAGRLRWRCRRGAKELDVLLTAYLEQRYVAATTVQQQTFERLLDLPDPELLKLLLGTEVTEDPAVAAVIASIREAADD